MDTPSPPSFFRQKPRPMVRLILSVMLSLALLIADGRLGMLTPVRDALSLLLYPAQWLVSAPVTAWHQTQEFLEQQAVLQAENRQLREQALVLTTRLQRYEELAQENQNLRSLSGLAEMKFGDARLSEVLYTGRDPFSYRIVIDKGSRHGLENGFPVMDEKGLIGQVTRVGPLTSEVTLITEKNHSVPIMVQRNGTRAVLFGTGGGIELRYVMYGSDVVAGDLLVTSGIDGVYPAGLDVARVSSVERHHNSTFAVVRCVPVGAVEQRRFALVLTEKIELPPRPDMATEASAQDDKNAARAKR